MRTNLHDDKTLRITVRCGSPNATPMSRSQSRQWSGAAEHDVKRRRSDSEIQLFKLNQVDANYGDNHSRRPDLSANIRIVFPSEEYIGRYVSHGRTKTVFVLKSRGRQKGRFDDSALKISRDHDVEPEIAKARTASGYHMHVLL